MNHGTDSEDQFTSDHGWRFPDDAARLQPLIDEARALGVRVSLFMDPLPEQLAAARATVDAQVVAEKMLTGLQEMFAKVK